MNTKNLKLEKIEDFFKENQFINLQWIDNRLIEIYYTNMSQMLKKLYNKKDKQ